MMQLEQSLLSEFKFFAKAQLSAFIGGIVDFVLMIALTELYQWNYVYAIIVGGTVGAVINFSINKYWTFQSETFSNSFEEGLKFLCVVCGSIILKSAGTFLFTECLHIDYRISRLITDALVCFGFNYTLQRLWVFNDR